MELSFGETIVLAVLAFVVLGPDELVRQSQRIGRLIGKIKTEAQNFRIMAEEEILRSSEMKDQLKSLEYDVSSQMAEIGHHDIVSHEPAAGESGDFKGSGSGGKNGDGHG